MPAQSDRDRLRLLGRCMYGEVGWQVCLARDLQVALRTVQRWASGSAPVPSTVWACAELRAAIASAETALRERLACLAAHLASDPSLTDMLRRHGSFDGPGGTWRAHA